MLPIFRPGPDAPLGLHGRALKGGLWRCLEVRSLSQGASGAVADVAMCCCASGFVLKPIWPSKYVCF